MATISNFYKILRDLCEEEGITVNELAQQLNLSSGSPTAWKNGAVPRLSTVERIATRFMVTKDYLLGNETKNTPTPEGERFDPEKNTLRIAGRDGSYIIKHLTDEQMQAIKTMVDHLPDASNDL